MNANVRIQNQSYEQRLHVAHKNLRPSKWIVEDVELNRATQTVDVYAIQESSLLKTSLSGNDWKDIEIHVEDLMMYVEINGLNVEAYDDYDHTGEHVQSVVSVSPEDYLADRANLKLVAGMYINQKGVRA